MLREGETLTEAIGRRDDDVPQSVESHTHHIRIDTAKDVRDLTDGRLTHRLEDCSDDVDGSLKRMLSPLVRHYGGKVCTGGVLIWQGPS